MADASSDPESDPATGRRRPWWVVLLWIIGGAIVVGIVLLHLTGRLGPGAHGP